MHPTILSAPPRSGKEIAKKGKTHWIKKQLGNNIPYVYESGEHKYKLSSPGTILIDDRSVNIAPWIKAGGIGIIHTSAKDTIAKLRRLGL